MIDNFKKMFGKQKVEEKPKLNLRSMQKKINRLDRDRFQIPQGVSREEVWKRILPLTFQQPPPKAILPRGWVADNNDGNVKASFQYSTIGQSISPGLLNWYGSQVFIGYQLCAMFAQQWLVDKACTVPADDAFRKGYKLTINDGTDIDPLILDDIVKFDNERGISDQLSEFVRMGRVFGIRVAKFCVNSPDPQYYEKPFNIDGVTPGSYVGIAQIDPYWITPELDWDASSNPASPHFYEPTWWRVNSQLIHRSHLVIYIPWPVSDVLKPTYFYGGVPLPQKIFEHVYDAERTAAEAPQLAMTKRTMIYKTDAAKFLANQRKGTARLQQMAYLRDNFGYSVVDLKDDDIVQLDTSLNDFSEIVQDQYQLVAAVADVPATKLLGTSPKGFNATGQNEILNYHEGLETIQARGGCPLLTRHHQLTIKSHIMPKHGCQYFEVTPVWNSLEVLGEKKSEIRRSDADVATAHINAAITSTAEERDRLITDPLSGYNGLSDDPDPAFEEALNSLDLNNGEEDEG